MYSNGELKSLVKANSDKLESFDEKFDRLIESNQEIASAIKEMHSGLISAVTGRDQVPTKVVMILVKVFGWLTLALVIYFTGMKAFLPHLTF